MLEIYHGVMGCMHARTLHHRTLHIQALPTLMTLPYVDPNQFSEVLACLISSPIFPGLKCMPSRR